MDDGDMSGDDNRINGTRNEENAKRPKIATSTEAEGANENNSEPSCADNATDSQTADNNANNCKFNAVNRNNINNRNYRRSGEGESSVER